MERIGQVSYPLKLLMDSKIHLVFYVSQLKAVVGLHHVILPLSQSSAEVDGLVINPEDVLATRSNAKVSWVVG